MDLNEIASNSIVGIALAIFAKLGNSVGKFIDKTNKNEKDLQALWPRFREVEAQLKEFKYACGNFDQAWPSSTHGESYSSGSSSDAVRVEQKDGGQQAG
jgi:hypothetical protein